MFDPRRFLALAKLVLAASDDEAALRSALSRAYYAAFLVAREYIDARNIKSRPQSGRRLGSHERVIFSVGAIPDGLAITMRDMLLGLKRLRTSADYDLDYADAAEQVSDALDDAERVIAWFDGLSGPSEANRYSADWFDLFLTDIDPAQTSREVAFLIRNLPSAPASILDVCCGDGRHAAPLAVSGYDVLGIDRDATVIDRARTLHTNARLQFRQLDMTRLDDLPDSSDAVICMWQSFGYDDAATNAEVLRQMAACLRSGGRLVLDLYNRAFFESRQGERESTERDETVVTRQWLEGDRLIVELRYPERGGNDRFDWQVFIPESIETLADRCDLRLVLACAGFDERLSPSPDQPRMQLVFAPA